MKPADDHPAVHGGFDMASGIDPAVNRLPPAGSTVVVAMSGGVDSSVAAAMLKESGCNVIGVTMHLWDYDRVGGNAQFEHGCCTIEDRNDARVVAGRLGIPYYVVDFRAEFERGVIANFVSEYMQGRTPNPCVACNSKVKFGVLLDRAAELGADYVATGHYARIAFEEIPGQAGQTSHADQAGQAGQAGQADQAGQTGHADQAGQAGRYLLKRGIDGNKDQSYALWEMTQDELARTVFPVGMLTKAQTRQIAERLAPRVAEKKDSYEICFIQDRGHERFLREWTANHPVNTDEGLLSIEDPIQPGPIVDTDGRILGEHRGHPLYTIGQRKGLGLAAGRPVYVVDILPDSNTIIVGDDEDLRSDRLIANGVSWQSMETPAGAVRGQAKIRYRQETTPAVITPCEPGVARVDFEYPQRAVTPGQSVVFYDGETVLGGGIIRE